MLPWRLGFRLLKWALKTFPGLYSQGVDEDAIWAARVLQIDNVDDWKLSRRLIEAVDRVDWWLGWSRNPRTWVKRYVTVTGQWPSSGPFFATGLHWGSAMWMIANIADQVSPVSLMARPMADDLPRMMRISGKFAFSVIAKLGKRQIIFTGKGLRGRLAKLRQDQANIVVVVDIPPERGQDFCSVSMMGYPFRINHGLLEYAISAEIPIVPYHMGLDLETGQRTLVIGEVMHQKSIDQVLEKTGQQLAGLWEENSAYWRLWRFLPQFSPEMYAGLNNNTKQ